VPTKAGQEDTFAVIPFGFVDIGGDVGSNTLEYSRSQQEHPSVDPLKWKNLETFESVLLKADAQAGKASPFQV
jgi:hypothetical protein